MKMKYLYLSTVGCILSISGVNVQAAGEPHPWVAQIVQEITKYGQSEACADGRALRKNHNNCATYDGAAIAKIVCTTHDHAYKDKFMKGQCGTKSAKTFGGVKDVGAYFEKAIDQGKPDAIALACTPPLEQLRGKLREVAMKKCEGGKVKAAAGPVATPAHPSTPEPSIKKETVKQKLGYMEELTKVLKEGPKLKPMNRRMSIGGAEKVTVQGEQISVPAMMIPEVTNPSTKQDLLQVAQDLSARLQAMNKALEEGETAPTTELQSLQSLESDLKGAKTEGELVGVVKKAQQEVVRWGSGKAKMQEELRRMRERTGLLLSDN